MTVSGEVSCPSMGRTQCPLTARLGGRIERPLDHLSQPPVAAGNSFDAMSSMDTRGGA